MTILKYSCMKCGTCCSVPREVQEQHIKRIPLYPEETDRLIDIAKVKGVEFEVIEDLVFPDALNQKILVLTYRIRLDNPEKRCPFYRPEEGCLVQDFKPMACQAYPLALRQEDAFNFQISVDPSCCYVINNYDDLKNANLETLKDIFLDEYPKAEKFYKKNKKLQLEIKKLEYSKEIEILRELSLDDFNRYLKEWKRNEIRP